MSGIPQTIDGDPRPHWVYLHLDVDAELLYVGCTSDRERRLVGHRYRSEWFDRIADVEYIGPLSKREARDLETAMIRELDPPYNLQYTDRDPKKVANGPCADLPLPTQRTRVGGGQLVHAYDMFGRDGKQLVTRCGRVRPVDERRICTGDEPVTCGRCIAYLRRFPAVAA